MSTAVAWPSGRATARSEQRQWVRVTLPENTPPLEGSEQRQWIPVIVLDDTPAWVLGSLRGLDEMTELTDNWDGYGSPRIAPQAITSAKRLVASFAFGELAAPHVSPVSGGAVGLHWRAGNRELELTVLPDGQVEYLEVLDQDLEREYAMSSGVLAAEDALSGAARMLASLLAG
jgi:hypothetical protein